jgi:uncharacterized protein (DUF3820 family)
VALGLNVQDMNDDTLMPFGKHKGKKLSDVPHGWFIYMNDRHRLSGKLKEYAEETVPILRIQRDMNKRNNQ